MHTGTGRISGIVMRPMILKWMLFLELKVENGEL